MVSLLSELSWKEAEAEIARQAARYISPKSRFGAKERIEDILESGFF